MASVVGVVHALAFASEPLVVSVEEYLEQERNMLLDIQQCLFVWEKEICK